MLVVLIIRVNCDAFSDCLSRPPHTFTFKLPHLHVFVSHVYLNDVPCSAGCTASSRITALWWVFVSLKQQTSSTTHLPPTVWPLLLDKNSPFLWGLGSDFCKYMKQHKLRSLCLLLRLLLLHHTNSAPEKDLNLNHEDAGVSHDCCPHSEGHQYSQDDRWMKINHLFEWAADVSLRAAFWPVSESKPGCADLILLLRLCGKY